MRSFCKTSLVVFASLGWATSPADAQTGGPSAPSLLPLPSVAPVLPNSTTASYITSNNVDPYNSAFVSRTQDPPQELPADNSPQAPNSLDQPFRASEWSDCNTCDQPSCGGANWFGSIGGLVMGRNRANPFWTTYQTNNNPNQLMNTQNAVADWAGGGQVTIGRNWCGCGCGPTTGLAFTYWGLGQMNGFASVTDQTGNINTALSTPIDVGGVNIGANPASGYFDNAHEQRIWRNDRFSNFELNVLQSALYTGSRLQLTGLAGLRYFRFDERLTYGSVAFGHNFGDNGGADEAYLSSRSTNNLFGGQVGAIGNFVLTQRLGFFVSPKAGIFANQMIVNNQLYSGDGLQGFNITGHKSDVSFLGELDSGFNWALTQNVRAYIGYRVIGVANLALSDNQFLPFLADSKGFGEVKQNGGLILHGAFAGVAWMF